MFLLENKINIQNVCTTMIHTTREQKPSWRVVFTGDKSIVREHRSSTWNDALVHGPLHEYLTSGQKISTRGVDSGGGLYNDYSTTMHGVHTVLPVHPHVYPRMEWAILYVFRKHSPDGVARARWRTSGSAYYSSIDPERMTGWVGLIS